MKPVISTLIAAVLLVVMNVSPASASAKTDAKKAKIDETAKESLKTLRDKRSNTKGIYERAYGYAVFNNLKISLMISGGGGTGVAVEKASGKRIYMKMGTAGLNIGLGAQKYQVVFFFENKQVFDNFVNKGWQADANANAVAGTAGANAEAAFKNGIAVYQITEAGLMLQADIAGTKYWKNKKLNK